MSFRFLDSIGNLFTATILLLSSRDFEIWRCDAPTVRHARAGGPFNVNGGVKTCHCGGAKVGQFGVCALERAALK